MGPQVMHLQSGLMAIGIPLPKYGVDGIYGAETQQAVRQAQQKFGLAPTGVAGPQLFARLGLPKEVLQPGTPSSKHTTGLWLLAGVAAVGIGIAIKKGKRN